MNHLSESITNLESVIVTMNQPVKQGMETENNYSEFTFTTVLRYPNISDNVTLQGDSASMGGFGLWNLVHIIKRLQAHSKVVLCWGVVPCNESRYMCNESDSDYMVETNNALYIKDGVLVYESCFDDSDSTDGYKVTFTPVTHYDSIPESYQFMVQLYYQLLGILPLTQGNGGSVLPTHYETNENGITYHYLQNESGYTLGCYKMVCGMVPVYNTI